MKPGFKPSPPVLAGAGAGVAVLVVGAIFAVKAIQGGSPPPLGAPAVTPIATVSGTSTPTPTPPDAAAPLAAAGAATAPPPSIPAPSYDGVWRVATGSLAGYRVRETLFGQSNIAVGRTSAITGSLTVSGSKVTRGSFSVSVATIKSDRSPRDDSFKVRIMDVADYPTATFVLTQPIDLTSIPAGAVQRTVTVAGSLTLHGVTRPVSLPVTVTLSGSTVNTTGSISITFAAYGIPNPSNAIAQTQDSGALEFSLNFVRS